MAVKEITAVVKLQVEAGKATAAPPVGSALGPHGINIMNFVKEFNERTKDQMGYTIPVVITIFKDRTFTFITKVPPVAVLIKKAIGLEKGSSVPNNTKVGEITNEQVSEIAKKKMPDLNASDHAHAMNMIAGTARSMGVKVVD